MGAALGGAGGVTAVCAASRAGAEFDRSGAGGRRKLAGLATSALRSDSICGDRGNRRPAAAALSHAANGEGANAGLNFYADHSRHSDSLLGSAAGTSVIGSRIRVQEKSGNHVIAHFKSASD